MHFNTQNFNSDGKGYLYAVRLLSKLVANNSTSFLELNCKSYLLFYAETNMGNGIRTSIYFLGLIYCFIGLSAITGCFFRSMAKVVQQTRKIVILDLDTGAEVVTRERIWNYTLADISLLAFGTSFPQISLSIIDAFQNLGQLYAGGLGPATLVGSAAFDLYPIHAVCVLVPKAGTVKKISDLGVWLVELVWSFWAYIWLYIIVQVWTPNVVTIWEAVLTVLQFGMLLLHAYAQDKGWHYFSIPLPREDRPEDWVPAETKYSSLQGGSHEDTSDSPSEFAPQNHSVDIFSIHSNEQPDSIYEHVTERECVETFSLDGHIYVPADSKGVNIHLVFLQQLKDALTMEDYETRKNSGVPLRSLKIFWQLINLPWRILFALVPPCDIAHGWLAFIISLCFITGISYVLTKLTDLISCVTGINPYVIAFTALASGTSWPDMVASKIAAERQTTAESAIANITCRSPYWQEMVDALTICGAGFKAPSEFDLRGPILTELVNDVKKELGDQRQIWSTKGCTIMTDGWTDRRNRTLLNFLVSSAGGTVFIKSIDASAHCKNATYLCEQIEEVINEVGEENVVQVVTDNAPNYVAAGRLLMERHPSIVWTPCAAHCIDLMLEDIGKLPWVKTCVEKARNVCKFVYNHSWVLALMRQYTEHKELARPGITRFATNFITLQSMLRCKMALRRMIVGEEWSSSSYAATPAGKDMADCIFDERGFWSPCDEIVKFVKPLVVLLRVADGEKPAMGYIYEGMDRAKEGIKSIYAGDESKYGPIWQIIDKRWHHQLHRPIHAAAYYLNPAFHFSPTFRADAEVLDGLYSVMEKMAPVGCTQTDLMRELQLFSNAQGETFSRPIAKESRTTMMPDNWWSFFGPTTPNLQKLAIRILSQPCSASGCERNWSMFEHIHSKRRNRLSVEKMNDLIFVHYNLRLRMRKNALADISPIILDEVDPEAEWAIETDPVAVFSDDDTDWIDQVDIEAEAVAMAEEEQRARAERGDSEADGDSDRDGDSDTDVPDVGEHGVVSRGAAMAAQSSMTYLRRLRRGAGPSSEPTSGPEGADSSAP